MYRGGTKYGGWSGPVREPYRPGPDNPRVNDARLPTVKDCEDRIGELQALLKQPDFKGAVRESIEKRISELKTLVKAAWALAKERSR